MHEMPETIIVYCNKCNKPQQVYKEHFKYYEEAGLPPSYTCSKCIVKR